MIAALRPVTALFLSAALILCGNGLETVLLPVRASVEGFTRFEIGLIGSSYWLGLTLGCYLCPRVILRVGHPRAFTVFTSLATVFPLLEAVWQTPLFWWLMRCATGVCFAGVLTVLESWINSVAPNEKRGRILSYYTLINFGALIAGQQLLATSDPALFHLFTAAAVLYSISAVPLALTLTPSPAPPRQPTPRPVWLWRLSPAAVAGSFGAGLANGAFWGLGPLYAKESGLPAALVASFMTCAVIGGALAQWPIGRLSDRVDRRRVLMTISLLASALGLALFAFHGASPTSKLALAFGFGAFALPIYWVSVAHANDYVKPAESVDVSSNLLLLFAVAATAGPLLGSLAASALAVEAIFLYTCGVHLLLAGVCLWRMRARESLEEAQKESYVSMPAKSSLSVFELDPRAKEAETDGQAAEADAAAHIEEAREAGAHS